MQNAPAQMVAVLFNIGGLGMLRLAEVIPGDVRARLAFELLASSSIWRYARVARSLATDSNVQEAIESRGLSIDDLLQIADETWHSVAGQDLRSELEVDLALALCIVSNSADPRVDQFLQQVGMIDRPSLSWVSALARHLSYHRPANYTLSFAHMHMWEWVWAEPAHQPFARGRESLRVGGDFWVWAHPFNYVREQTGVRSIWMGSNQRWSSFMNLRRLIIVDVNQDSRSVDNSLT